jgi:hypothetical protein
MTSMPRQHKNHLERAQVAAAATVGYAEWRPSSCCLVTWNEKDTMSWPAVGTIQ